MLVILLLLMLPKYTGAQSQTSQDSQGESLNQSVIPTKNDVVSVRLLSERRRIIAQQLHEAQHLVDQTESTLEKIQGAETAINGYQNDLRNPATRRNAQTQINSWQQFLTNFPKRQVVEQGLKASQERVRTLTASQNTVEDQLSEALDVIKPQQSFKTELSIAFAALIAVVIVGFYLIGWKDASVRSTIFAGDAGLQFITLFALIIAIILFGLTDILEGRELAALLGGISGYILGRSSATSAAKQPPVADKIANEAGSADKA